MKKLLKSVGLSVLLGLAGAVAVLLIRPELGGISELSRDRLFTQSMRAISFTGPASYRDAVEKAAPAVVSIATSSLSQQSNANLPLPQRTRSLLEGSGVIVDPAGYILTNHHVIKDAGRLLITLRDGREGVAWVVGTDPESDLAVLKTDLPDLPYLDLQNSETEIGDVVLAIGNPFGLGQTVTMGIISATGRNDLQLNTYEDFIQTDAAINIGNSGGALVNAYGDLVGISTLLFTRGGGSEGVGFVIPSSMARFVMDSIIKHGRVIRGWLGIESQPLSSALAHAYGVNPNIGIVITGIYADGPADRAGLRRGDILTGVNGQSTRDGRKVMNMVARIPPGQPMTMQVLRDGQHIELTTQAATRPTIVN